MDEAFRKKPTQCPKIPSDYISRNSDIAYNNSHSSKINSTNLGLKLAGQKQIHADFTIIYSSIAHLFYNAMLDERYER